MITKMYTVFDSKTEAYLSSIFFRANGEAIRAFVNTVQDKESQIGQHPEDYTLFYIGTFDDEKGKINWEEPASLGNAIEFQQK